MDTMEKTREGLTNRAVEILGHALARKTFNVASNYDEFGTPFVSVDYSYVEDDGIISPETRKASARVYLGHTFEGGLYVARIFTEYLCGSSYSIYAKRLTVGNGPVYQTALRIDDKHSFDYFVRFDIANRLAIDWVGRLKRDTENYYKRQTFIFDGESLHGALE